MKRLTKKSFKMAFFVNSQELLAVRN